MITKTTFGPVASRRFGLSLGIDLSPNEKSCNFDCVYCELEKAPKKDTIKNPPSVENIINDIRQSLKKHSNIEVLTITGQICKSFNKYADNSLISLNINKDYVINGETIEKPLSALNFPLFHIYLLEWGDYFHGSHRQYYSKQHRHQTQRAKQSDRQRTL